LSSLLAGFFSSRFDPCFTHSKVTLGTPRLAIPPERQHQIFERDPTALARSVVWEDPHGRGGSADEVRRAARGFCPTVRDRTEAWQVRACLSTKVRRRTPVVMSLQCLRFAKLKARLVCLGYYMLEASPFEFPIHLGTGAQNVERFCDDERSTHPDLCSC